MLAFIAGQPKRCPRKTNPKQIIQVKTSFKITLAAAMLTLIGGSAFAGQTTTSTNNRAQATPPPAPRVEYKPIWDNRGQLIAVLPVASR